MECRTPISEIEFAQQQRTSAATMRAVALQSRTIASAMAESARQMQTAASAAVAQARALGVHDVPGGAALRDKARAAVQDEELSAVERT